jgi:hypothetical protein
MSRTTLYAVSVLSLFVSASALQASSTWTCSAVNTGIPTAINNAGQIVGTAGRAGFLQNPDGSITPIAYPGTTDLDLTVPGGINQLGEVAGYYTISGNAHGFIRRANGDYEDFDLPAPPAGTTTSSVRVGGINNNDDISLSYVQGTTLTVAMRHNDGSYTPVASAPIYRPGPAGVGAINDAGTLVVTGYGIYDGYLRFVDGTTTYLGFPGATTWMSERFGLNNKNETAGYDFHQVGFVGSLSGGLQSVVCPDSPQAPTQVVALNDQRQVVGTLVGDTASGFVATPTGLTAELTPSNDSWTFSPNPVGVPGGQGRIYLNSKGPADVHVTSIYVGDASWPGSFALTDQTCTQTGTRTPTATLTPGDWCAIDFQFTPKIAGWQTAAIYIVTDSPTSPIVIPLGGTGLGANLQISNRSWQFGALPVGQSSGNGVIYIYNNGGSAADFGSPQMTGANPGDFAVVASTCGSKLPAYQTCAVAFNFTPTAPGQRQATLQISTNATQGTVSIPLSGYGY